MKGTLLVLTHYIGLSLQDPDSWRIWGSGNICYTGMDEEEEKDDVFHTYVTTKMNLLSPALWLQYTI